MNRLRAAESASLLGDASRVALELSTLKEEKQRSEAKAKATAEEKLLSDEKRGAAQAEAEALRSELNELRSRPLNKQNSSPDLLTAKVCENIYSCVPRTTSLILLPLLFPAPPPFPLRFCVSNF